MLAETSISYLESRLRKFVNMTALPNKNFLNVSLVLGGVFCKIDFTVEILMQTVLGESVLRNSTHR